MNHFDIIIIGGGPAGAATAIRAARGGASVAIFEKAGQGRDKVCGDGLTPRAMGALDELKIVLEIPYPTNPIMPNNITLKNAKEQSIK